MGNGEKSIQVLKKRKISNLHKLSNFLLLKTEKEKGRIDIDVFEIYNERNENVFSKCSTKYLVVFNRYLM